MVDENVWRGLKQTSADADGPIVGIDFGTSNSCLAVWHYGKNRAKVVRNAATQQRTTPSTVVFDSVGSDGDEVTVGVQPEDTAVHVVEGVKLLLGADRADPTLATRADCGFDGNGELCLRNLVFGPNPTAALTALTVEAAAARVIGTLKASAESYYRRRPAAWLGNDPTAAAPCPAWDGVLRRCVLGVPASYTDQRRSATRRAAAQAGFTDVHLMVESTAAAMAYGLLTAGTKEVLVVDMGCGTLDCTALGVVDGACTVRATAGAVGCGGRRIDELLMDHALAAMGLCVLASPSPSDGGSSSSSSSSSSSGRPATSADVPEPARGKLLAACRICKEAFSSLADDEGLGKDERGEEGGVEVVFPVATLLTASAAAAKAHFAVARPSSEPSFVALTDLPAQAVLRCVVSKRAFDAVCAPVTAVVCGTVRSTIRQWRAAATAAAAATGTSASASQATVIDEVVLVGGSSRARPVRQVVRRALVDEGFVAFYRPEAYTYSPAATAAAAASAADAATATSTMGGKSGAAGAAAPSVPGLTSNAAEAPGAFCTSVDADEAVALGLAMRGAALGGRVGEGRLKDLLMLDVLPSAIGVLCWEARSSPSSSSSSTSTHETAGAPALAATGAAAGGERIFEPVLAKGTRLPSVARRAFTVAAPARPGAPRLVSLDVYEEVEEWGSDPSADSAGGGGLVYTYQRVGTYDFPVPAAAVAAAAASSASALASGAAVVDVVFTMSADGALTIAVEAPVAGAVAPGGASTQELAMFRVLVVYLVALAGIYLAAKALLHVPGQ